MDKTETSQTAASKHSKEADFCGQNGKTHKAAAVATRQSFRCAN